MFPFPRGAVLPLLFLICAVFYINGVQSEGRVVCYYTNWSVYRPGTAKYNPQNINPYLCTHLIYAFGGFTKDNQMKPFDKYQDIEQGGYAKFTGLKTYNKQLKTMIAIGGWNEASTRFSPLVGNPERRQKFIKNILKFLRQNHFDGIDLDWEYPAHREGGRSQDRENYAQFVQELRAEFEREAEKTGRTRLLLTMAVPAGIEYIEKGYDIPKLNKYLDWFNLLTYDFHASTEPSVNHHAPLYSLEEDSEYNYDAELNIDYSVKFYLNQGADRDKLVLGIPTYGRSYTLINEESTEIGAPAEGPGEQGDATREKGYLAYYEICQNIKDDPEWTVVQPNANAVGPYAFRRNQWVGYDDEAIVRKKSQYVVDNGLGGIMFWAIDNDDFRGTCTGKPYPLIEAAKEAMLDALGLGINEVSKPSAPQKPSRARSRENTSSTRNRITTTEQKLTYAERKEAGKRPGSQNVNSRNRVQSTTTTTAAPRDIKLTEVEGSSLYIGGRTTTPPPPTTPDPGTDFKCEDEGFFQHPRDCKKYYWCLDSGPSGLGIVAHQFTCPSGLYFNPAADSCDFARNVPCKTKKSTTAAPITTAGTTRSTTTTARPTQSQNRIALATTRSGLFRTTTTTTTTTENPEYEYEEDEEDNHPSPFAKHRHFDKESEEDPKVIKELIELIRKLGGVEELEKHLLRKDDGTISIKESSSSGSSGPQVATTPPTISKSLYDKVLSKPNALNSIRNSFKATSSFRTTAQTKTTTNTDTDEELESQEPDTKNSGNSRYSSVVRGGNSRQGPQNEGLDKLSDFDGFLKEKKQYTTINRSRGRSSIVQEQEEVEDQEDDEHLKLGENNEEVIAVVKSSRKPGTATTPAYASIRRSRPITTAATDVEEQADKELTEKKQYSTLNRSRVRGSTTTTTEPDVAELTAGSTRYKYLERSRPVRPTTESSTKDDDEADDDDDDDEEDQDNTVHTKAVNRDSTRDTLQTTITTTNTNTQKSYSSIGRRTTTTTASPEIETETATTSPAVLTTTTTSPPTTTILASSTTTTETPITSPSSSNVETTTPDSIVTSHTTTPTPTVIPITTTTTNPDTTTTTSTPLTTTTTTTLSLDVPTTTTHPNDILDMDLETLNLSHKINSLMSDSSLNPTTESGLDTNKQESDSLTTTTVTTTTEATNSSPTSTTEVVSTEKTRTTTTQNEGDHKDENEVNVVIKERKKTLYTTRTRTTATPSTTTTSATSEVESNPTSSLTNSKKLSGVRRQQILLNRSSQTKATTSTTELTPTTETVNSEFLGTVSSPRPFGFPKKRTRPTTTGSTSTTTTTEETSNNSSVGKTTKLKAAVNSQIKKVSSDTLLSKSESQTETETTANNELISSQREHEVQQSTNHSLSSGDLHAQQLEKHVLGQVVGIEGNLDLRHDNTQQTRLRTQTTTEDEERTTQSGKGKYRGKSLGEEETLQELNADSVESGRGFKTYPTIIRQRTQSKQEKELNGFNTTQVVKSSEEGDEASLHKSSQGSLKFGGEYSTLNSSKYSKSGEEEILKNGTKTKSYTTISRGVSKFKQDSNIEPEEDSSSTRSNVKSYVTNKRVNTSTKTNSGTNNSESRESEANGGFTTKSKTTNSEIVNEDDVSLGGKTKSYTSLKRVHTATATTEFNGAEAQDTTKGQTKSNTENHSEDLNEGTKNKSKSYTTIKRVHTETKSGQTEGEDTKDDSGQEISSTSGTNGKLYSTVKRVHTTTTKTDVLADGNEDSDVSAKSTNSHDKKHDSSKLFVEDDNTTKGKSYNTVKRIHTNTTTTVVSGDKDENSSATAKSTEGQSVIDDEEDAAKATTQTKAKSYTTIKRVHKNSTSIETGDDEFTDDSQKTTASLEEHGTATGSKGDTYGTVKRVHVTTTTTEVSDDTDDSLPSSNLEKNISGTNIKNYTAVKRVHNKNTEDELDKSDAESTYNSTKFVNRGRHAHSQDVNDLETESTSRYGSSDKATEKKTYTTITRNRGSVTFGQSDESDDSNSSGKTRTSYYSSTDNIPYKAIVRDSSGVHLDDEELSGFVKSTVNRNSVITNVEKQTAKPYRVISRGGHIAETQVHETKTINLDNDDNEELTAEIEESSTDTEDTIPTTEAPTTTTKSAKSTTTEEPSTTRDGKTTSTTTESPTTTTSETPSTTTEERTTTSEATTTKATTTSKPSTLETTRRLLFKSKTSTTSTTPTPKKEQQDSSTRKYSYSSKNGTKSQDEESDVKESVTSQAFERRTSLKNKPSTTTTTSTTETEVKHETLSDDSKELSTVSRGSFRPSEKGDISSLLALDLAKKQGGMTQQQFGSGKRRIPTATDAARGSSIEETTTETVNGRQRTIITRKRVQTSGTSSETETSGLKLKGETSRLSENSEETSSEDQSVTRGTYRPSEKGELSSLLALDLAKNKQGKQTQTTIGNGKFRRPAEKATKGDTEKVESTTAGVDVSRNSSLEVDSTQTQTANDHRKNITIRKRVNTTTFGNKTQAESGENADNLKDFKTEKPNLSTTELGKTQSSDSTTKTKTANGRRKVIVSKRIVVNKNSSVTKNGGEIITTPTKQEITENTNTNSGKGENSVKDTASSGNETTIITDDVSQETSSSKSALNNEDAATDSHSFGSNRKTQTLSASGRRSNQSSGNVRKFNSQNRKLASTDNKASTNEHNEESTTTTEQKRVKSSASTKLKLQSQSRNSHKTETNSSSRKTATSINRGGGIQRTRLLDTGKTEEVDYLEDGSKRIKTTIVETVPTGPNSVKTIKRIKTKIIKKQEPLYEDNDESTDASPTTRRPASHNRGSTRFESNDLSSLLALDYAFKSNRRSQGEAVGQKPRRKIIRRPDIVTETEEVEEYETELPTRPPTTTTITEISETKTVNGNVGPTKLTRTTTSKVGSETASVTKEVQEEVVKTNAPRRNFTLKRPENRTTTQAPATGTDEDVEKESTTKRNLAFKRHGNTKTQIASTTVKPTQASSNETVVENETSVERTKVVNNFKFKKPVKPISTTRKPSATTEQTNSTTEAPTTLAEITTEATTTTESIILPVTEKSTIVKSGDGLEILDNQLALAVNKLTTETDTIEKLNQTSEVVSNSSTPEDLSLPLYHRRKYYQYYKDSPITYVTPIITPADNAVISSGVDVAKQIHDVFNVSNNPSGETAVDEETSLDTYQAKEINNELGNFLLKTPGSK